MRRNEGTAIRGKGKGRIFEEIVWKKAKAKGSLLSFIVALSASDRPFC